VGNALKPVSNTLPAALEADAEAARDFARESLSPATRRAYRTDIRAFEAWCSERGVQGIPAAPETVASFLAHEAQRGLAVYPVRGSRTFG
jgi:site-specific recombinase XerD